MKKLLILFLISLLQLPQSWAQVNWEELNQKTIELVKTKDYTNALANNEKAIELAVTEKGKEHADYAKGIYYKAFITELLGQATEAEKLYLESIALYTKLQGSMGNDVFYAKNDLGKLYEKQNKFVVAENLFEECAAILLNNLGDSHSYYAKFLSDLAYVYEKDLKYDKAIPNYEKAIEIYRKTSGINSDNYLLTRFNLAYLYYTKKDWKKAEEILNELIKNTPEDNKNLKLFKDQLAKVRMNTITGEEKEHLLLESLQSAQKSYSSKDPFAYMKALMNLSSYYVGEKNYVEALKYAIPLSDSCAKYKGDEDAESITFLHNIAFLEDQMNLFDQAEKVYLEVLEKTKNKFGDTHPDYITFLSNLALHYYKRENYPKALPLFETILAFHQNKSGEQSTLYLNTLESIASVYQAMGNYSKAEELLKGLIERKKKMVASTDPYLIDSYDDLIYFYKAVGYFEEAEKVLLDLLSLEKTKLPQSQNSYAAHLIKLGDIYQDAGRLKDSEKTYLQVEPLLPAEKGNLYLILKGGLADLYMQKGQFSKAEIIYTELYDFYKSQLGTNNQNFAILLNNIGTMHLELGNFPACEKYLQEALALKEKLIGKLHSSYALSLSTLADCKYKQNKNKEAEELYMEALSIYDKTVGTLNLSRLAALNGLASVYSNYRRYEEVIKIQKEILLQMEQNSGTESPNYAIFLNNLANTYKLTKDYPKAEDLFKKALSIQEKVLGQKNLGYITTLNNLALLYFEQNQYELAKEKFLEVDELSIDQIEKIFPYLNENEKSYFSESLSLFFHSFYRFASFYYEKDPKIMEKVLDSRLINKGIILNAYNSIKNKILHSKNPALIQEYEKWVQQKEFISKVYQLSLEERKRQGLNIESLENESDEQEKKVSLMSDVFANERKNNTVSWKDIQSVLKEEDACIELIQFYQYNPLDTASNYIALVFTKQSKYPELVEIKNGNDLENKYLKNYRNSIRNQLDDKLSYAKFWEPIQKTLDQYSSVKKIYISNDGVYNQLNLSTLYDTKAQEYLIDRYSFHPLATLKNILLQSKKSQDTRNAVLIGRPQYNLDIQTQKNISGKYERDLNSAMDLGADKRFFDGTTISDLPGTEAEINSIKELLSNNQWNVQSYMKEQALEEVVKTTENPTLLHIATHGFFIPDQKNKSGLKDKNAGQISNPMLRSGILLAGVNNYQSRQETSTEDGILTAYEASLLDLEDTEIVILSACETGLGDVINGEGVYGLQRAFQIAGAKSIMMSLWKVSDQATQKLMTNFYQEWIRLGDKRKAFESAQQLLRKEYPKPYYWGAFILVGE